MNQQPNEDPQALRNQLFRYAQDLQDLMTEHHELQRRHFAMLQSRSRAVLDGINPFGVHEMGPKPPNDIAGDESTRGDELSWRETITVWLVIGSCAAAFSGLCVLFWYRHIRG
jgi:hypothetical protein